MGIRSLSGWLILGALLLLGGCSLITPKVDLPVYLRLEPPRVKPYQNSNFTTTLGPKDYWLFLGDQNLGIYNLPAVVPVYPEQKDRDMLVAGGIFENGLSDRRSIYPFWRSELVPVDVDPLDTVDVAVTFSYLPDTALAFPLFEEFETPGLAFDNVAEGNNATDLEYSTDSPFRGMGVGKVSFSPSRYIMEVISRDFLPLPTTGSNAVYAEITYRCDVPFTGGLFFTDPSGFNVGELPIGVFYNSNLEWNTVYLHLTPLVRSVPPLTTFKFYLRANSAQQPGTIYFDDIRIVFFSS